MADEIVNKEKTWTVREPYHILCSDDEDDEGNKTVDENGAPLQVKRKIRPTRRVPAYFQNFLRECDGPGMHTQSESSPQSSAPSTSSGSTYPRKTRLFNTQNMEYFLPSDHVEFQRLQHQHDCLTVGLGGLYPCPEIVREVLAPSEDASNRKSVLDLGCGNGAWLVDMAYEFPHADFLGVDLIPCPTADPPPNISFEIDDINHGLEHFAGKFDLVHARLISFGIKNYRKTMEDISRCIKPGGLVIFIEVDMELLALDRMTVIPMALTEREMLDARAQAGISGPIPACFEEGEEGLSGIEMRGSWLQRILYELRYASRLNGSDFMCAEDAVDEGLWRMHAFDLETCGASSLYVPASPWPQMRDQVLSQQLKYAGSLMRQDLHNAMRAVQPLFLKHGIPQAVIDQWVAAADYELMAETFRAWVRLRIAWGRRRSSTPPSEVSLQTRETVDLEEQPNHQVEVYQTLQESMMAKARRTSTRVTRPVPFLVQIAQGKSIGL